MLENRRPLPLPRPVGGHDFGASRLHQALHERELPSADPAPEHDVRGVFNDLHALKLVVLLDHPLVEQVLQHVTKTGEGRGTREWRCR